MSTESKKTRILGKLLPNYEKKTLWERIKNIFCGPSAFLWWCFIIPAGIMYLLYLAREIHPFGDGSVLVLDLNAQYVYFYEALHDFVWGDQSLLYSFSRQLGGEYMGIYAYYVASPFSYIVALFPKARVLEALLFIFILKTGLCGVTFGYYLKKTTPADQLKKTSVIMFSCMYALCSYAIVHQNNSMWIDALIWLPLLTLGIEELIKNRRFKLFVSMLALTLMSNYYIGYMVCIYTAIYFFYYYAAHSKDGANNPLGEKTHFARSLLRIIIYSALAIGIAAVIVFTAYYSLSFGKNTFSNPSWEFELKFDIMDYLTKFLPGSYDNVRRSGLPFVYCGTLMLFMLPVYFISPKRSSREKAMSGLIIAIFSISFMVSIIDLIWHGFQEPNWLNYRYSFMLSFLMLVMAHKGFCDIDTVGSKIHMVTSGVITFFLMIAQKYTFESYFERDEKFVQHFNVKLDPVLTIAFTLVCVGAYLIILSAYKKSTDKRRGMSLVLVIVVCIELLANGISNVADFHSDVIYSSYSSYHDFMDKIRPTVDAVLEKDTSFYRMEKINHRRTNDNMALNIRGLSNSSSTLNRETNTFLGHMGYSSAAHKSIYKGGNIVNDSLLGVRYIIAPKPNASSKNEEEAQKVMLENNFDLFYSDDNYNVYYNPYALSIAFGVSGDVSEFTFLNEKDKQIYANPFEKNNAIISSMVGADETLEIFKPIDVDSPDLDNVTIKNPSIDKHTEYRPTDSSSASKLQYTFTAERDGEIYFYLPSFYTRKVELTLNGVSYGDFYGDDSSRIKLLGYFNEGDEIKLTVKMTTDVLYVKNNVSPFYYIDEEVFKDAFETLSKTQLIIDDDYSEDKLSGTITTLNANQTIQTTIPYDEGWIITVDGKKVDTYKTFDALIAFDIADAGEHEIVLKYRSKAFVYGMVITVASIVIFTLLIVFEKKIYGFIYTKFYNEPITALPVSSDKENDSSDGDGNSEKNSDGES